MDIVKQCDFGSFHFGVFFGGFPPLYFVIQDDLAIFGFDGSVGFDGSFVVSSLGAYNSDGSNDRDLIKSMRDCSDTLIARGPIFIAFKMPF
jgi:hypothetical protein